MGYAGRNSETELGGPEELRLLNEDLKWVVEPGVFRVMIGRSSKDMRLRGQLTVR